MVVGFNHNFRYKGEVYHIQTEDSGAKNPQIVTLLYCGGTILVSKKISYAELGPTDNLSTLVEEMMKDQHREMLRRLKNGELDDVIAGQNPSPPPVQVSVQAPVQVAERQSETQAAAAAAVAVPAAVPVAAVAVPAAVPVAAVPAVAPVAEPSAGNDLSLDDIILSYLIGEES